MHFHRLQLTQFRNYAGLDLEFSPGINCFFGPNGSGKTNILDALHFLAFTKGFRTSQDKQAVREGDGFFLIQAELTDTHRSFVVACNLVKDQGKKMLIDQAPLEKMSHHIGTIPLVAILPNDTELIVGPSAARRKFLDMLISQYDSAYLQHLIQYEKLLARRNALLKLFAEQHRFDAEELDIWNTQLVPHGIRVYERRQTFLEEYLPVFEAFFRQIISQREQPHIRYRSQITQNSIDGWLELLHHNQARDRANQYTSAGIHRDDLIFTINDQPVRNFGSQGQQKTFVVALKFAQYFLLNRHTSTTPVLLLDDIFDKLDESRLVSISHLLDREIGGQVFVTDTSYERLARVFQPLSEKKAAYFQVNFGQVDQRTT